MHKVLLLLPPGMQFADASLRILVHDKAAVHRGSLRLQHHAVRKPSHVTETTEGTATSPGLAKPPALLQSAICGTHDATLGNDCAGKPCADGCQAAAEGRKVCCWGHPWGGRVRLGVLQALRGIFGKSANGAIPSTAHSVVTFAKSNSLWTLGIRFASTWRPSTQSTAQAIASG